MDWTEAQAGRVGAGVGKAGGMGARPPTATQRRQGRWRWARPWALLLLLLGPQLPEARGGGLQREVSAEDQRVLERYLPATVEYAVHEFNLRSQDENAYKVKRVLRSWREPSRHPRPGPPPCSAWTCCACHPGAGGTPSPRCLPTTGGHRHGVLHGAAAHPHQVWEV
ncbi:uncharacterized protein [Vicugna pacos]|uniref:Uncharacterized protein isoform X2 n=1 Tax=Vicugna pacos TaxID=30538 RepID=A0ABM5BTJ9_VICPA